MKLDSAPIAFFDSTYEEALALTRRARDYFACSEHSTCANFSPEESLLASCESMRVTSRLTQVMAWFLVQKAVHNGELPREEALNPENRLHGHDVCTGPRRDPEVKIPVELQELLDLTLSLYERVARLDSLLDS